jgi:hypothetical protein
VRADDPRHGTLAGSGAHYKSGEKPCTECREARRRWYRRYNKQRRQGYVRRIECGHGGVWDRLDNLLTARGYSYHRLASELGIIRESHLYNIHKAGPDGLIRVGTWQALEAGLNALRGTPTQIGTLRRLQALHRIGWPIRHVMLAAGVEPEVGKRALRGEHMAFKAHTMHAVADVYDRLSMSLPTPSAGVTRAVRRAERMGWPPPLSWDDIDDPDEQPRGIRRAYEHRDLLTEWAELEEAGESIEQAARRLGVTVKAIEKARERRSKEDAA